MTDISSLRRRALGAVCLAAIVVAPAACGGGDDDDAAPEAEATATTTTAAPSSCADRFLALTEHPDIVEAARTDADALSTDAFEAVADFNAACKDELEGLPDSEVEALVAQADPDVIEFLGSGAAQRFSEVGQTIGDG